MHMKGERVAAYARYSSDRQSESSVEDQLRRLRSFASTRGVRIDEALTFTDHAISGASTQRPAFEALMEKVKRREIDVLLVEDTSRLSRDNADALNLYKTLAFYGVQLLAISDGIDSSTKGAKLAYSVKALMSDLYLEDLRDKTLRGMEGRAHSGHATGGRLLGYRSVPIIGPDGRTPTAFRVEIDPEAAQIVRRIFVLYAEGLSFNGIATTLNREGVSAPRDKTKHERKGGWVAGTVRAILYNERYAGVWTFNERRWVKVPGTNKRRPEKKDPSEVIRTIREELRIIEPELWEGVKARLRDTRDKFTREADGSPKGRAHGFVSNYAFSGLLVCGVCKGQMTVMGGDADRRYYRCANSRRGRCENKKTVRTDVVQRCILDEVHSRLASPEGIAYARKQVAEWLGEVARGRDAEMKERRSRLARTESRIANLVDLLASGERSQSVRDALSDMEAHATTERNEITELERLAADPARLPAPEEVLQRAFEIRERVDQDPIAGREALRNLLDDAKIYLDPPTEPKGFYTARGHLLPLVLLQTPQKTQKPLPGFTEERPYTFVVAGAGFEPTTFGL